MVILGYAAAVMSPTYRLYELEMLQKEFTRNPHLDNPLMGLELPNAVRVGFKIAVYGIVGLLFTAGVALLIVARNRVRILGFIGSVLFAGGCLAFAIHLLEHIQDCFPCRFIPYGLGLSVVAMGLCIGGLSSIVACSPFRIEAQHVPDGGQGKNRTSG
jgi:hypothetical protein